VHVKKKLNHGYSFFRWLVDPATLKPAMPGSDLGPGEGRFLASDEPFRWASAGYRFIAICEIGPNSHRIPSLAEDLGADETKKQISGDSFVGSRSSGHGGQYLR
jgi:hypothetical protein